MSLLRMQVRLCGRCCRRLHQERAIVHGRLTNEGCRTATFLWPRPNPKTWTLLCVPCFREYGRGLNARNGFVYLREGPRKAPVWRRASDASGLMERGTTRIVERNAVLPRTMMQPYRLTVPSVKGKI